ncbi:RDD family protein [Actinoplanes sp. CA-051413]|uniref:RDD family protein n=1 Tax=Actinoplanes sp. CA-051413 TaxID=3239899 RepID=UPI003D99DF36
MATSANGSPTPPEKAAALDLSTLQPAKFGRRLAALLIDWALCLVIASFYADPRVVAWPPVVVLILFNALFIGLFGQTLGMSLARIRAVSVADGGAIGILRGLLRGVLLALLIPAIIMDAQRRGLHDRAAGSIVVALPKR